MEISFRCGNGTIFDFILLSLFSSSSLLFRYMSSVPFATAACLRFYLCTFFPHKRKEKQITNLGSQKIFPERKRILAQKSNFPFSRFHTSYIALYSTNNVCLVCTIIRGFRQVRSINFASDHVASMSDFFFFRLRSFFREGSAFLPKIFRKRGGQKTRQKAEKRAQVFCEEKRADIFLCRLKKISFRKTHRNHLSPRRNTVVNRKQTSKRASLKVRAEVRLVF